MIAQLGHVRSCNGVSTDMCGQASRKAGLRVLRTVHAASAGQSTTRDNAFPGLTSGRLFMAASPLLPAIFVAADCGHRLLAAVAAAALLGCVLYALWLLDSEWSAEPVRCSVLDGMTGAEEYLAEVENERWRARAEYVARAAKRLGEGCAPPSKSAVRPVGAAGSVPAPQQPAEDERRVSTLCERLPYRQSNDA